MLRGEKVILRPIERDDLKRLHELSRNVDLTLLAQGGWNPWPLAAMEKEFDKHLEDENKSEFVIEADGLVIGTIELHRWKNRRAGTASLGVSIFDPNYLGKGYGRDALNLLLDWSFRIQNYRRIELETLANNERAFRSYRACGFVEEGRKRQSEYVNGEYVDVLVMGVLRTEWEARRRPA
ncbi:MAG TPA: GNAT family protein [Ktedonobacterales bacterium]|nr:GNAT family protein [Ktedonobacterales bacterium]